MLPGPLSASLGISEDMAVSPTPPTGAQNKLALNKATTSFSTHQLNLPVAHDDAELTQVLHQPVQHLSDPFSLVSTDFLQPLQLGLQGQRGGLGTVPQVVPAPSSCFPPPPRQRPLPSRETLAAATERTRALQEGLEERVLRRAECGDGVGEGPTTK